MKFEIDSDKQTVTVGKTKFAFACLEVLMNPDKDKFYKFSREGDTVWVCEFSIEEIHAQVVAARVTGQQSESN
jgi:hypothetical protein